MSSIEIQNATINLPVFSHKSRSLRNYLAPKYIKSGKIHNDGTGAHVQALTNINLSLKRGDRLGIIGENGSGKSTMLRMLGGVYQPKIGKIKICGKITSLIDISLGMDLEATGRENIWIRARLLGFNRNDIKQNIDEIIEFTELGEFIDLPMRTYSTGMQMRLSFSTSTLLRPEILLMDEWLSVGDEKFVRKAENRLQSIVNTCDILVLASHSRDLIERTCSKVVWLENGKIKQFGIARDVCRNYFEANR